MEEDEEEVRLRPGAASTMRDEAGCPGRSCCPVSCPTRSPLTRMLSEQVGRRVELVTPQRGAKMDLIRLANQNAAEEVARATTREERQNKLLEALGQDAGHGGAAPADGVLRHLQHWSSVTSWPPWWSMWTARPLKRDYRRFKLKDMEGPDDYASMEQVLTRRFRRYLDGDEKFAEKPDLLLIDGGAGACAGGQAGAGGHGRWTSRPSAW